jgi:hypothetical protein
MAYRITLRDENLLWVEFVGDVSSEDMENYIEEYKQYLERATAEHPFHFLVDSSQVGKLSAGARKALTSAFRVSDPRVGNTALFGANRYARVLTSFVLKAVGRDDIRMFDSEEEAVAWLKEA